MKNKPLLLVLALAGVAATGQSTDLRLDAETAAGMAVRASTLTTAATDRLDASEHAVKAADAARLPILIADARYTRHSSVPEFGVPTDDPTEPVFILFPNIENHYRIDLTVSQPIYTGGAISANRDAARRKQSAASWSQSATALDLAYRGRMLYWSAVAAAAAVDVAEAQRKRSKRLLDDARALREAGMAVNADVYAAEARFAAAAVDVIRSKNEAEQALARLRSLLGIERATGIVLDDTNADQIPARPPSLVRLENQALTDRPELKITEAQIDGLEANARAVNAIRKPTVAATGQYLVARPNSRYLPPVDEVNDSWLVSIGASWQFFDGSRTKARVAEVEAERRARQQDKGELERQILLEVSVARLDLESALEAVTASDASAAAAEAWEEASSERYAAGLAMLSELLDAQADLTAAEVAQVRTRVSAWTADATLKRAIGQ